MRGAAAVELDRAPGALPLVTASLRAPAQERECAQGQGGGGVSSASLPRPLQAPREQSLRAAQPLQAAAAVAGGALPGGGECQGSPARRRRQVPRAEEVPAAAHHLGRRGDELLLQGEVTHRSARLVPAQSVSVAARETRARRGHRPHHHPGEQLVQESQAARPSRRGQRQVRFFFQFL